MIKPTIRIESKLVNEDGRLQVPKNKITVDGVDVSNYVTAVRIEIGTRSLLPVVSLEIIPSEIDIESTAFKAIRPYVKESE